jgi:hypothetical protein
MKSNKNFIQVSIVVSLGSFISIGLVGCGGAPSQTAVATTHTNTTPVATPAPTLSVNSAVATNTGTSTTTSNLNSAYHFNVQLQNTATSSCNSGSGSPTPSGVSVGTYTTSAISTDNIFKVTLTAQAPTTLPCTGYTAQYSCVQYTVTVGNQSQTAYVAYGNPMLSGFNTACKGASGSVTLDFSSAASPGHGPLKVSVSQPQSDNCHNYADASYYYYYQTGMDLSPVGISGCPMSPIYQNQIVSAQVSVETNHQ